MRDADESLLRDFLAESADGVDQLDADLLALERDPSERGPVASAFRTLHTLKGNAGILGLLEIEAVAHAGEEVLGCVRDGRLPFTPEVADALLLTVDAVRRLLDVLERTGAEPEGRHAPLRARLTALRDTATTDAPVRVKTSRRAASIPEVPEAPATPTVPDTPRAAGHDQAIRVRTGLLDRVMNLVGELVLARNQLREESATAAARPTAAAQRIDALASELEEGVVRMRLQPIDRVLGPIPRMARDLAVACGKDVRVEIEGRATELDRTVVDAVKDPITHLVRNAVAHGIETPEERAAAGKSRVGRLRVRATHEAARVVIEISDDGRGIDAAKVGRAAIARGMVTEAAAARLGEAELLRFVFRAGLSTADAVTPLAGRGVGLDVVRTNIERIGGAVDVRSTPGGGTTFRVSVPLTLAIVPALVLRDGDDRFAVSQAAVAEVLRAGGSNGHVVDEGLGGAHVVRWRGTLLPLVTLPELLGGAAPETETPRTVARAVPADACIVVLQAGTWRAGLVVGDVGETQDIVVRPLPHAVRDVPFLTGAAVLGDGRVAAVLDAAGIARRAGLDVGGAVDDANVGGDAGDAMDANAQVPAAERRAAFVVVEAGGGRAAIPLARVARLEEVDGRSVEAVGDGEAMPYRGSALRLVRLAPAGGERPGAALPVQVVVCDRAGDAVGVVVDQVVDIVDMDRATVVRRRAPGRSAAAVIDGRVTELVEVDELLREAA